MWPQRERFNEEGGPSRAAGLLEREGSLFGTPLVRLLGAPSWYASVRLFRQGPDRQWAAVLARVAYGLRRMAKPLVSA